MNVIRQDSAAERGGGRGEKEEGDASNEQDGWEVGGRKKKGQRRKETEKKTLQAIGATQWVIGCGRRLAKIFGGEKPLRRKQRGWLAL